MAEPTRKTLQALIEGRDAAIVDLQAEIAQLRREIDMRQKETAHMAQRLHEEQDYTQVLAGDRDRLTAALELCTRRLASPNAERLLARSGWRAGNLISPHTMYEADTKSEDATRTLGTRHHVPRH